MVFIQFILVHIKPRYAILTLRINEEWVFTKPRLNLETFNRGTCGFRRPIDTDELNVFLSAGEDIYMLNNKNGFHLYQQPAHARRDLRRPAREERSTVELPAPTLLGVLGGTLLNHSRLRPNAIQ